MSFDKYLKNKSEDQNNSIKRKSISESNSSGNTVGSMLEKKLDMLIAATANVGKDVAAQVD